ncbi:helix-turn-helix transcriptional regulator [Candidatus Berkiella aquae]|uniref:PAS domain-containing protein n=1 Tax=Candidatus Berkiella aquae TaxID=295108 RepID=A0A0Q9Z0S0_9GAMM|nr:PAS domain-containing protein [Candidatus Berkiella aquae]MCS5711988.1 PAS domain-containing protein [Candidatus Berkiella aquae]
MQQYIPICDAMVQLMHPLIEIVIHEIDSDKIIYLNGTLSARKVGDPSLLEQEALEEVSQIIYPKINFDGKLIKSISVLLENKWLLCINCDISVFSKMQNISELLLSVASSQPRSLFVNDWQEKLHLTIHDYLQKNNLSFENLHSSDKKDLVKYLLALGAFNEKKAADYVAKILDLGRATVFKYLKELR